jgi:hypothetical protein
MRRAWTSWPPERKQAGVDDLPALYALYVRKTTHLINNRVGSFLHFHREIGEVRLSVGAVVGAADIGEGDGQASVDGNAQGHDNHEGTELELPRRDVAEDQEVDLLAADLPYLLGHYHSIWDAGDGVRLGWSEWTRPSRNLMTRSPIEAMALL